LNGISSKTFKVTPKNPNPNGSYQISLYYTDAEKTGYETATGLAWSSLQMVKSEGAISGINPANQQSNTVTVNNSVSKSLYGTDHMVTATFNNGFSGFAVGSPGVATSVNELNVLKGVRVYPNPVGKQINISFDKQQRNVSLRIMSADGRVLYVEKLNGSMQNHMIATDQLIKGIYLLEINAEEGRRTLTFVKQ
jgi:hypothetical protein